MQNACGVKLTIFFETDDANIGSQLGVEGVRGGQWCTAAVLLIRSHSAAEHCVPPWPP